MYKQRELCKLLHMLSVGIVGLPNVGKSTLFNALTLRHSSGQARATVANFPFTTIDPNIGVVTVPDERLEALAKLSASERVVPTAIEFVDIAGLVKGAHAGEGLGNQFLAHIREVDAIAEVVRFFPDPNVTHVADSVDPARDADVIHTELALADLQTLDKMLERDPTSSRLRAGLRGASQRGSEIPAEKRVFVLQKFREALAAGQPARSVPLDEREREAVRDVHLLTQKPILYIANLDETQIRSSRDVVKEFAKTYQPVVPLSVKIEQELGELPDADRAVFLGEYGLSHSGLDDLIRAAYDLLGLITFLTTGPKETRAWTVVAGSTAPQAAGKIHSDFERGFIRAETVPWKTLVDAGSYAAARERGLVRDEGKEYRVQDGDVLLFKTSA